MEWIILLIIVLVVYFFFMNNPKKVKEGKIKRLEESADNIYIEQIDKQEKNIKEDKKTLSNVRKAKKEILGFNEEEAMKSVKTQEQKLEALKEFKKKYIRLKERYAFSPVDERLNIAFDYHTYMTIFLDINQLVALATHGSDNLKNFDEIDNYLEKSRANVRELRIKQEKIERRFDEKLSKILLQL